MKETTAREALRTLLRSVSEDTWCAGWYKGLEYFLWRDVQNYVHEKLDELKYLSEFEVDVLYDLVRDAGGWFYWPDGATQEQFIPLAEWQELYAKRGQP